MIVPDHPMVGPMPWEMAAGHGRPQILALQTRMAPTATKAVNLLTEKPKCVGTASRRRQRPPGLLLHCGVTWQTHRTARLRGRSPRLVAKSRITGAWMARSLSSG
jgi:hypothetical protein